MTERERFLAVLRGETPDRVPYFLDLGHWWRAESGVKWDLFTVSNCTKEITDLHREVGAGWYVEVGSLHEEYYDEDVQRERVMDGDEVIETYRTPIGEVVMKRRWNPVSSSWDITKHMVETIDDLKILTYAMRKKHYRENYKNWEKIEETGGDVGLGFPGMGYTGLGSLISYYMGVENTIFAAYDEPELLHEYVDVFNAKMLEMVDLYCEGPAPHMIFTDNLSSDVQSPELFREYSFDHYRELAARLHAAGKTVSAHVDGRMNRILPVVAEAGIDVADACTPKPTGDLTPAEVRRQAGNMVMMGGVSPRMWLPETGEKEFVAHVREWLDQRKVSPRIVQSAGDQVPPGTKLQRIKLMREIVEEYGRY